MTKELSHAPRLPKRKDPADAPPPAETRDHARDAKTHDAPSRDAPINDARPRLLPAPPTVAEAHAAVGNSALLARGPTALRAYAQDPLRLQTTHGNGAVQRAARDGASVDATQDLTAPSVLTFDPLLVTGGALAAAPPVDLYTFPPDLITPAGEEDEAATTFVFDEERIVARAPAAEGEKTEEEAAEDEAAREQAEEEKKEEEAAEEESAEEQAQAAGEERAPEESVEAEARKKEEAAKPAGQEVVEQAEEGAEAPPEEGEVEEAEETAEEEIEADAEAVEEGTKGEAAAPGGGGGAGAAPELAEWKAKVSGATAAIKKPDMGEAKGAGGRVRAAGGAAVARQAAAREGTAESVEKVIPPPPKAPDPLPTPADDPVPDATQRVRDASDKKLPNQKIPALVATPGGHMPKPPGQVSSAYSTKVMTESEAAAAAKKPEGEAAGEAGEKDPEKERVKDIRDAKKKAADTAPEEKQGAGEPLVLVDEGPPAPAPMTKETQADVGRVLAVLAADPHAAAEEIVRDARRAAYPKAMLLEPNYDDFGTFVLPDVETSLTEQLGKIREQAGISEAELKRQVEARRAKLRGEAEETKTDADTAGEDEKQKLKDEGQKNLDANAGARDAADTKTGQQVEAASDPGDPAVVKAKRERLVRGVSRKVAQQSVAYKQAGERREKSLDDTGSGIESSYTMAAREDEKVIFDAAVAAGKTEEEARKESGEKAKPSFVWLKAKLAEVRGQIETLKTEAKTTATSYDTVVKGAGVEAQEAIRAWAESQLSERQSWWEWLMDLFSDWGAHAEESTAVWEEAQNAAARDEVVRGLDAMKMVQELEAQKIDGQLAMGMAGLTDEQRAVIKAYYEGPTKGDSIAAVAAGLRTRISAQRQPEIISRFQTKLEGLPADRWKDIDLISQVLRPGKNAYTVASEVHQAVDQWGTDEDKIFSALSGLTPLGANAARKCYTANNWGDMDADIKSELGGDEQKRAFAQLSGNQALADAAALREAISGLGTDEQAIMQTLRGKTKEEREAIIAAYNKEYGDDLKADLDSDLGGHDWERADALMAGDTARADAIAIDQAMHGGLFGLGTEEKEIENTYAQIRGEVEAEAAAKGWTTAQVEAEIKKRNGEVESAFNDRAKANGELSLKEAFADEMEGAELDLANALHDNDPLAADMARLQIEKEGFYTEDDAVNKVLRAQGERARKEVERDLKLDMQERAEIDALRGFPWDKARWEKERTDLDANIEKQTQARAEANMSALEKGYDKKYGKYGEGSLRVMIAMNMSGTEKKMANDLLKQGGILRPEQEIDYAIEGAGTDEDAVKKTLAGKSPAQIKKIREAWEKKHPNENFDERVLSEFDGRERFDIELMLDGEPQTPQEKLKQAKKKLSYEQNAYLLGGYFSEDERKRMEAEEADLEKQVERLESLKPGTEEYERAHERYQLQADYFDRSVEDHRTAVDSLSDTVATVAGVVATIAVMVVAVVATVLTGGAAAPGLAAAIGAVMANATVAGVAAGAAALATVGAKLAMKGSAYGMDEMGVDLAVGAADALASALTAGLGGKLLKAGRLAALSKSGKLLPRLFANAMAEGAEGFASSLPSALTGAVLDDKNWKGNPAANILGASMIGVGMGTVLSGGMGMLGGISKPASKVAGEASEAAEALADQARKHPPKVETPEMIARRGSPLERVAGFDSFQKANPGKSYDDFLAELDAGVLTHKADDEAVQMMEKRLRGELFEAIPPGQRDQFKDVAVSVVSDAEFERLTKSAKGQAVVLVEEGKPRVLLRESADPKALREEGIHLLQSADPEKAHIFRQLDESVMKEWDKLPLDEQLSLYSKKLDLEIDGQQKLIRNLEESLAAAGDDAAARKQLLNQIEEASETLENLSKRLDEVGEITPQKRLDIAAGKTPKPDYLDQPARLFSKKPPKGTARAHVKFLDDVAAKGLDATRARSTLVGLRTRAASGGRAVKDLYRAVAGAAEGLGARKGLAFVEKVGELIQSRPGKLKELGGFLEAAADAVKQGKNPTKMIELAAELSERGAKQGARLSNEALSQVAKHVSLLDPDAAVRFLKDVGDVLDSFKPRQPEELSGLVLATIHAKPSESKAVIRNLKKLGASMKDRGVVLPAGTARSLGSTMAELPPQQAVKYIKSLEDFTSSLSAKRLKQLDDFILGSTTRAHLDPKKYFESVKELIALRRSGLSEEGLRTLAAKTTKRGKEAHKALDPVWLMDTDLVKSKDYRELFDFMAQDPKTAWHTFREASQNPTSQRLVAKAESRLRGVVGEFLTFYNGRQLKNIVALKKNKLVTKTMQALKDAGVLDIIDRQVLAMRRKGKKIISLSEVDFLAQTLTGKRGLEVKTYAKQYWDNILDAWDTRMRYGWSAMTPDERKAVESLDHLLRQLRNARAQFGRAPLLMTSEGVDKIKKRLIPAYKNFEKRMPKGTKLIKMSQQEIEDAEDILAHLLGIK